MPRIDSPSPAQDPLADAPESVAQQTLAWLNQNVWVAASGGIANYLVVAVVLWSVESRALLVGWTLFGTVLAGVRMLVARCHRTNPALATPRRWLVLHRVLTLASGLHFSVACSLMFPEGDPQRQALIAILAAGMVASAVGFHALDRVSVLCFTLPPTLLIAWRFADMHTLIGFGIALLALVFLLVMWRSAAATRQIVHRNIELGLSLHYHATHDPLVPLPNRSEFMRRLREASADARQPGTALLYVDLDHFKLLNDTLGHAAGDEALLRVANQVRGTLRATDVAARLGGDEFVVMMRPTTTDAARHVAEKLLDAIAALGLGAPGHPLAASIGVAVSPGAFDPDRLLDSADRACYRAKQGGRARVEVLAEAG